VDDVAKDDIAYVLGIDLGAPERFSDNESPQLGRRYIAKLEPVPDFLTGR